MTVKEVLKLDNYRVDVPVMLIWPLADKNKYAMYPSPEWVPDEYMDLEILDHEYLSEGDGNPRHDTIWIDVAER